MNFWSNPFCFMIKRDHFKNKLSLWPQVSFKIHTWYSIVVLNKISNSEVEVNTYVLDHTFVETNDWNFEIQDVFRKFFRASKKLMCFLSCIYSKKIYSAHTILWRANIFPKPNGFFQMRKVFFEKPGWLNYYQCHP